jgi:hypothetical protein
MWNRSYRWQRQARLAAGGAVLVALLVALVLLAGLLFATRIATAGQTAPVFVVAFTTMLILFGAGLSPFRETGTAFATRLLYVLLAGGYAIGMLALIEPLRARPRWAHERICPIVRPISRLRRRDERLRAPACPAAPRQRDADSVR